MAKRTAFFCSVFLNRSGDSVLFAPSKIVHLHTFICWSVFDVKVKTASGLRREVNIFAFTIVLSFLVSMTLFDTTMTSLFHLSLPHSAHYRCKINCICAKQHTCCRKERKFVWQRVQKNLKIHEQDRHGTPGQRNTAGNRASNETQVNRMRGNEGTNKNARRD